jgi:methylated-DNA-[protein]-cysteine S-methyltransferase
MQMFTAYVESPLGLLKVKATDAAVTAILFTESIAEPAHSNSLTDVMQQQLKEYFDGSRKMFQIPFEQKGTDFQAKVWNLLYKIPYGKTISYSELSKQYGDLKAIRAVAAANGRNNLSIVIPCHRVIGSNATLTGYAGGLWRKKWLLDHEARFYSGVQSLF